MENTDERAAARKAARRLALATYRDKYITKGYILLVSEVAAQKCRGTCEQGMFADGEVRRPGFGHMPRMGSLADRFSR
jgi:hypothetical protein